MVAVRRTLYDRLPEIYRIKDEELVPAAQLEAYLAILEQTQSAIYDNIESLYHDLFIDTCHDWVVPYISDLLGTSHLSGDPWTIRADVARTIKHRRRKGTLGSIESLAYALSGWAVHTVELRDRLVWNQHLNHQRPDRNGEAPLPVLIEENGSIGGAVQGGTLNLRDPALLSFVDGPFDPFAKVVDVKPMTGSARYNIPNLGIFVWRLEDYTLPIIRPSLARSERFHPTDPVATGDAEFVVGFDIHPLGEPMVLFNTHRFNADAEPPNLSSTDAVPGPMPYARLSQDTPTGNPGEYVVLEFYASESDLPGSLDDDRVGLTLYLPDALDLEAVSGIDWTFRGANLCAWQDGLNPPLREYEIAIDPEHGRILFGVTDQTGEADVIANGLLVSPTYGAPGGTGAHPISRDPVVESVIRVNYAGYTDEGGVSHVAANGAGLQEALHDIHDRTSPLVIQIEDSRTYDLDLNAVSGVGDELGLKVLVLRKPLQICAASGQRPIIRLARPLAFRPYDVNDPGVETLDVVLDGLYLTWDKASLHFAADTALIERAAVNQLALDGCTLDPGSHETLDGTRQDVRYALKLDNDFGFDPAGGENFDEVPRIAVERSICGPMAIDDGYELLLQDSIIDAASGIGAGTPALSVHAASSDAETEWGPALEVHGMTSFGRMRVESATGDGGIWAHALEVHDDQVGCIKFSYFSGIGDKLPQHQGCVFGTQVALSFASEVFGAPDYGQIRLRSDDAILEQGPDRDAMGAFGYLLNTHKWKNINIRYREFMPVGINSVLIAVT